MYSEHRRSPKDKRQNWTQEQAKNMLGSSSSNQISLLYPGLFWQKRQFQMPAANTFNRHHGKSGVKKLPFCCQFLQDKCSKLYFALANKVHLSWEKSTRTFAGDLHFELQFKFPALAQRPGYNKQTRAARAQHVFHLFLPSQLPSRSVSCPSDYVDARCSCSVLYGPICCCSLL